MLDALNPNAWDKADRALDALRMVLDPELGINIVDLGLVSDIIVDDRTIEVEMTSTSPACPLSDRLTHDVTAALRLTLPEVIDVRVNFVWQPAWDPMMMSPAARSLLGW